MVRGKSVSWNPRWMGSAVRTTLWAPAVAMARMRQAASFIMKKGARTVPRSSQSRSTAPCGRGSLNTPLERESGADFEDARRQDQGRSAVAFVLHGLAEGGI